MLFKFGGITATKRDVFHFETSTMNKFVKNCMALGKGIRLDTSWF